VKKAGWGKLEECSALKLGLRRLGGCIENRRGKGQECSIKKRGGKKLRTCYASSARLGYLYYHLLAAAM